MKKMALLIATDDWKKMDVYQKFLSENQKAVWRIKNIFTNEWIIRNSIQSPINLYFYHKSYIRYCANCIEFSYSYSLSDIPKEYHNDVKKYSTFINITSLEKIIEDTHISEFPKWDDPEDCFDRGNLGIFRVIDILENDFLER